MDRSVTHSGGRRPHARIVIEKRATPEWSNMRGVSSREYLIFRYVGGLPVGPLHHPPGFSLYCLTPSLASQFFGGSPDDGWRAREYLQLLDEGCRGFVLAKDDSWAAVQWISPPSSRLPAHLPTRIVFGKYWCFYEHTRSECRRQGLWRHLKLSVFSEMQSHDPDFMNNLYSDTEPSNTASRKAHERFGFVPSGIVQSVAVRVPPFEPVTSGRWIRNVSHPAMPMED